MFKLQTTENNALTSKLGVRLNIHDSLQQAMPQLDGLYGNAGYLTTFSLTRVRTGHTQRSRNHSILIYCKYQEENVWLPQNCQQESDGGMYSFQVWKS